MSSNAEFGGISFDLPKNQSNVIKVIGVGGGGSNAINHMFESGIKGVDFVICNTDSQALENSPVPNKIQLGMSLTEGLGAGANPDVGEQSALESFDEIKNMLGVNTKMVFITAGMGGGTGTGAAPIIARMAKELDVLTVGIVTVPFQFEGKMRNEQAQTGVEKLRKEVDSLIVINNNKLREVYGNLGFKAGFAKADEVLATAAKGIAEVITHHYMQNIDLRDAKTVLSNSGSAIMGSATASGANRANEAIIKALDSPLLNDNKITGAKNVLLLIISGTEEITIDEIGEINEHIQSEAGNGANIIMGVGEDESLGGEVAVTIIATGFEADQQDDIINTEAKKIIHALEENQKATQVLSTKNVISDIELPKKVATPVKKQEPIIRHTLFDNPEIEEIKKPEPPKTVATESPSIEKVIEIVPENEQFVPVQATQDIDSSADIENNIQEDQLIPTSEIIKNIDVVYDEVVAPSSITNEEFIIKDVNELDVITPAVVDAKITNQNHEEINNSLDVEVPIATSEELFEPAVDSNDIVRLELTDEETNPNQVLDEETTSSEDNQIKRYVLEDETIEVAPTKSITEKNDDSLTFKVVSNQPQEHNESDNTSKADPFNAPIEETLRSRANTRRQKLKEFNYKFRNNANANNINEIEKQPAYKRMGIDLNESNSTDNEISRLSISKDDNNDTQLRSNNSFLHDNVD
jgi:cell division protein FtsZ